MTRVIDKDLGFDRIMKALKSDLGVELEVGFIDDPVNATKAMFNEFGTQDIPARPFMRETFARHDKKYQAMYRDGLAEVSLGKMRPRKLAESIGREVVEDMRDTLTSWSVPPNDSETAEEKGANRPLVDSGAMRDAITYRVKGG